MSRDLEDRVECGGRGDDRTIPREGISDLARDNVEPLTPLGKGGVNGVEDLVRDAKAPVLQCARHSFEHVRTQGLNGHDILEDDSSGPGPLNGGKYRRVKVPVLVRDAAIRRIGATVRLTGESGGEQVTFWPRGGVSVP